MACAVFHGLCADCQLSWWLPGRTARAYTTCCSGSSGVGRRTLQRASVSLTSLSWRCALWTAQAPEVVMRNYGPEADLWSAGVTLFQLLSGRLPFRDAVREQTTDFQERRGLCLGRGLIGESRGVWVVPVDPLRRPRFVAQRRTQRRSCESTAIEYFVSWAGRPPRLEISVFRVSPAHESLPRRLVSLSCERLVGVTNITNFPAADAKCTW